MLCTLMIAYITLLCVKLDTCWLLAAALLVLLAGGRGFKTSPIHCVGSHILFSHQSTHPLTPRVCLSYALNQIHSIIIIFHVLFHLRPVIGGGGGFKSPLTRMVCTPCYRAPEVVMSRGGYTEAIDMWGIGCVFGELLQRVAWIGKATTPQLQVGAIALCGHTASFQ